MSGYECLNRFESIKSSRSITIRYYVLAIGVLLNISAYVGILFLQSSLHITDGLGTTSASVLYICAVFLSLFFSPSMLVRAGAKWSLVVGEVGFLFFSIANFYPSFYSMIPGAILGSLGEALLWSSSPVYLIQLVNEFCSAQSGESSDVGRIRNRWFGHFYGILKSCQIWGNLLSYAVLYGARDAGSGLSNSTGLPVNISMCGSNFCPSASTTSSHSHRYVPKSRTSVYLLLGVYVAMQLASILMHTIFLPNVRSAQDDERTVFQITWKTLKETFRHVISLDQILLMPTGFYYGLIVSYAASNFTRAFVSCSIGVQQVGLAMVLYGFWNVVTALFVGQLAHRFSLTPVVVGGIIFDAVNWTVDLVWRPEASTKYLVYVFGSLIGVSDGIWQTTSMAIAALFFTDREEIAFVTVSLYTVLGLFCGFCMSGSLCVRPQIWILFGVLLTVAIGYAIAETKRRKRQLMTSEESRLVSSDDDQRT